MWNAFVIDLTGHRSMCDIACIDSLYSIAICRVALRHRAACQLTVNSYANMAIWCQPVLVFLSPRTAVLPTVTAKCQSYNQAQQVFGRCSYIDTPPHPHEMWCGVFFALVLVTSYFIMANVFLANPKRRHNQLDDMPLAPSLHLHTCVYVYIHVGWFF